jgi:hypothetical protein
MKRFITSALLVSIVMCSNAQVKIGGNAGVPPDATAVLDLEGGATRGLLLPRMRKIDMLSIVNPAEGLTLYVTDEQATYLRRQGNWVKLSAAADAFTLPYTGSFSTVGPILSLSQSDANVGSVARFQITNAASKGNVLEVISNSGGYTIDGGNAGYFAITNPNNVGYAIRAEVNASQGNSGTIYAENTGTQGTAGRFILSNSNSVGNAVFATTNGNGSAVFANASSGTGPGIEVIGNNFASSLFAWKQVGKFGSAASFRNSNSENTAPVVRTINSGTGPGIQMDGINPQITLRQDEVAKGFLQLNDDDLRFGTVFENATGQIVLRTAGGDRVFVNGTGIVSIGGATPPPGGNRLNVKGSIAATAFNVVAAGSWPDYVFGPTYKLRSLEETETFINANKHLPGVLSAKEIETNGYELSDMQKRMMEKIEELTLHLIEANKRIKLLEEKLDGNKQ